MPNNALGLTGESYTPDRLIAGEFDRATRVVTLHGAAALVRGAVLGRSVAAGAVTSAPDAGNTGNGVLGALAAAAGVMIGNYRVVCIAVAANGGEFAVFSPDGVEIGRVAVGGAAFNNQITFTIADGAADFVAGDAFTITVAEGAETFQLATAAAVDGSQDPCAILVDDADPSGGDVQAAVYLTGEFSKAALTFGAGLTAANTLSALAQKNIYLRDTVGA